MKSEIYLLILHFVVIIKGHNLELCSPGYYRCSGYDPRLSKYAFSKCIREDLICDGVRNCYWNEDEKDCGSSSEVTTQGRDVSFIRSEPNTKLEFESQSSSSSTQYPDVVQTESTFMTKSNSVKETTGRTEEVTIIESFSVVPTVTPWPYLNRGPKISDKSSSGSPSIYDSSEIPDERANDTPWIYDVDHRFPDESVSQKSLSYDDSYDVPDESSEDKFLIYDVSPKFDDGSTSEPTWIYDVIPNIPEKDDNITGIEEDSDEVVRTRIELVIAIMISIFTVFLLVVCVIFQKKLSRNKKRRKLSIGRRMRKKYSADERLNVSA